LPANKVFGCREMVNEEPLLVGGGQDWIVFCSGRWTLHLAIEKDRRFPHVDEKLRRPEEALTHWTLSPPDAEFLLGNLQRLPVDEDDQFEAVTIDLNGHAAVRAKNGSGLPATELVLTSSPPAGQGLQLSTDRRYLARALRLGFREFSIHGADVPVHCQDQDRQYIWMPLGAEGAIVPSKDATRIESSGEQASTPSPPPRRNRAMSKAKTKIETSGQHSNGQTAAREAASASDTPIAEALAVKQALQDALAKTNVLITALKRQTRQSRLLKSTLESLRQLQTVTG
jgi:hypothetical protein